MNLAELNERLDDLRQSTGEARRRSANQILNADESVIPLLCRTWSEGTQPMGVVEHRSGAFVRLSLLFFIMSLALTLDVQGFYGRIVRLFASLMGVGAALGLIWVVGFLCWEVVKAKERGIVAGEVLSYISDSRDMDVLLAYSYCSRNGESGDKVLVVPAAKAMEALLKDGPPLAINYHDSFQVDSVRLLLTRISDLSHKRELVLEVLKTLEKDETAEFLAEVRSISKIYNDTQLRNVARQCLAHLEQVNERRKQAFTLLRPSEESPNAFSLMRSATSGNKADAELLLRESQTNENQSAGVT